MLRNNEVLRSRAASAANDPAVQAAFDALREQYVSDVEHVTLNGSADNERTALELIRKLQVLAELRQTLARPSYDNTQQS